MSELLRHIGRRKEQVTKEEIELMNVLRNKGCSYSQIAKRVNRAISTVFHYTNGCESAV